MTYTQDHELQLALGDAAARQLANATKTVPQLLTISPRWFVRLLHWLPVEAGDEVIIPAPYWLSYPEMVTLAGGTSVIVNTSLENHYKITPEQLEAAITPKTKLFVLNSPSNPTGIVYTPEEIAALANIVVEKDILVVSDEIYEKILYDGAIHRSIASFGPEIFQRSIISNGFAKAFSMTGWRVGYIAGPVEIVKAMTKIQSHSTSNVCTFAQYGAIAALESPQDCIEEMVKAFSERRQYILERVRGIPGLNCPTPNGAFYVANTLSISRNIASWLLSPNSIPPPNGRQK